MDIFEFNDYKNLALKRIESMPKKGYGQLMKLSKHMRVNSTFLSQVFKGPKNLSLDQAIAACNFFGFSKLETQYFMKLVEYEKAGTVTLKEFLQTEIDELKSQSKKIIRRLEVNKVMSLEDKAIFYSDWYYSAMRLSCGIEGRQSVDDLTECFGISRKKVSEVVQFLLKTGLLRETEEGLRVGPSKTHIESDSPFVKQHHENWRGRALDSMTEVKKDHLHYSSPMTLDAEAAEKVRAELVQIISKVGKIISPAPTEQLMCLNIDWFEVK